MIDLARAAIAATGAVMDATWATRVARVTTIDATMSATRAAIEGAIDDATLATTLAATWGVSVPIDDTRVSTYAAIDDAIRAVRRIHVWTLPKSVHRDDKTMIGLSRIHQIEVTTRCNLRCVYCPHPQMSRPKIDMDMATFGRALAWVRYFRVLGTQPELSLTGIGEGLLHPRIIEMMGMARDAIGDGMLLFATNGINMTSSMASGLRASNPIVYISLHRPEVAGPAIEACKSAGLRHVVNDQFATSAIDWAGQVDWHVSHRPQVCQYLAQGWGAVMVDGGITRCCMDSTGEGVYGHVNDEPSQLAVRPFVLCRSCSLTVPG